MTREEAIDILQNTSFFGRTMDDIDTAIDLAVKALEQEPCEDAISRKEFLKAIYTWDKFGCDADNKLVQYQDHYIPYIHYDDVVKCIKGMSSVTPQPKMGRWIDEGWYAEGHSEHAYRCSECGEHYVGYAGEFKYCPNCGAKMEVEE